jgi:hypothetical protein
VDRLRVLALVLLLAVLRAPGALGQPVYLAIPNPQAGAYGFGQDVAAFGDDILVGDYDASKVYLYDGDTGALLRTFVSPNVGDSFGYAVAAVGTNVLIGAPADDTAGENAGAAYLFDGSTGALLRTFINPAAFDSHGAFGEAVAASGTDVLIGAPGYPFSGPRTAYLYDGSTGALLQTFSNGSSGFGFGTAIVDVGGDVAIGASSDPPGGLVYIYDRATGALVQTLANPDPVDFQQFGRLLAPFGANLLVGAQYGLNTSAAYLFDPATAALLVTYPIPPTGVIHSLGVHGGNVFVGTTYYGVLILHPATGATLRTFWGPTNNVFRAAAAVGNKIVAGGFSEYFQDRSGVVYSFCGGLTECGPCETCDASNACVAAPHPTCRAPLSGRSTLVVKDLTPNGKDRVLWKTGGSFLDPQRENPGTVFGAPADPSDEHDYTLCMYESTPTPSLVFRATAPAAGDCGGSPCWRPVQFSQTGNISGYTYLDGEQTPHGIDKIFLRTTTVGGGLRLKVQAKGENLSSAPLGMAVPPFDLPLRVQLQNRHGYCWESTYTTARRNVSGLFRATSNTP